MELIGQLRLFPLERRKRRMNDHALKREEMVGLLPTIDRTVRWCSVTRGYERSGQNEIVRLKGNTEVVF